MITMLDYTPNIKIKLMFCIHIYALDNYVFLFICGLASSAVAFHISTYIMCDSESLGIDQITGIRVFAHFYLLMQFPNELF